MMRSFSYAAFSAVDRSLAGGEVNAPPGEPLVCMHGRDCGKTQPSQAFLSSYRQSMAAGASLLPPPRDAGILLDAYLLEKASYELLYELNNRPTWVHIPLNSILTLQGASSFPAPEGG